MKQKIIVYLDRFLLWGVLAIVFLVPLVFSRLPSLIGLAVPALYVNLVFNLPKTVVFSILVDALMVCFFIKLILARNSQSPAIPPIVFWSLLGLLTSYLLATLFGQVPVISFFGQYEKSQGLLMQLHYLLFFILVVKVIKKEHIPKLLFVLICSAGLVGLYGLVQGLGYDPLSWSDEALRGRIFSTFGHPNYLAYYFIFTLPLTFYALLRAWRSRGIVTKATISFSLLFQILALLMTESRGAVVGLVGAALLILFLWGCYTHNKKLWVGTLSLGLAGLLTGLAIFFLRPEVLSSLRLDTDNARSVQSRLVIWQDTWSMILQRPWLGYGLDSYPTYFPQFKSPALLDLEHYQQNADRAHNILLDTWQSIGIIGLLATSFFVFALLWLCWKMIGHKNQTDTSFRQLCLTILIILTAFFTANLFGFPVVGHDIYFWLLVGLLVILACEKQKEALPGKTLFLLVLTGIFTVLAVVDLGFQINLYRADSVFLRSIVDNNNSLLQEATRLNPYNVSYALTGVKFLVSDRENLLNTLENITQGQDYRVELSQAVWQEQHQQTEAANRLYQQLVQKFPAVPEVYLRSAVFDKNQKNFSSCTRTYEKLLAISPAYWQYDGNIKNQPATLQERYRLFFKENPNFRDIFENLSFCALQDKNYQAVPHYAPHMTEQYKKYLWLSEASSKLGQPDLAQTYLEQCQQLPDGGFCKTKPSLPVP